MAGEDDNIVAGNDNPGAAMAEPLFRFQPRWKEELVVTGSGGSFVLELPMGVLSAYLPSENEWKEHGPEWARDLWPELRRDLDEWCRTHNADLYIIATASVYSL
jgi:hypothetical protein